MPAVGLTLAEMRARVLDEGGFDVETATVDGWLNDRLRKLVGYSLWRKGLVAIGSTVIGESVYELSDDVVDLEWVTVGGVRYDRKSLEELNDVLTGVRRAYGSGGIFAPTFSGDGSSESIRLYPTPDEAGLDIIGQAALLPSNMTDPAGYPPIPADYHEALVAGAIATGLKRVDERHDSAQPFDLEFQEAQESLRRRRNSRQGSGPHRIRVGR